MELHLIKDFPEKSMLKLENRLRNELFNKAIFVSGSKRELAFRLNTSWNTLYRLKKGVKFIPFKIIQKLLDICKIGYDDIEDSIKEIRFRYTTSFKVLDQKLTINFGTKDGIKLIAALAGDGYLNTSGNVGYVNKNRILRNDFLTNLYKTFSCIELPDYSRAYRGKDLSLSRFFGYIFEKAGFPKSRKVFVNPSIPRWILDCQDNTLIGAYLQQLFDDEGHISVEKRMIDLPQSVDISEGRKVSNLLEGIRFLLGKIDITANLPYSVRYYEVKEKRRVYSRVKYVLTISSYSELKKFRDKIGFLSKHKQERINKIISRPTLIQRKNKQIEKDVLEVCRKMQSQHKVVTSLSLAKELKLGEGYCQKLLKRLTEENKITKINNKRILHRPNGDILGIKRAEFQLLQATK